MTNVEGPHLLEPVQAADGEAAGKPWSYRLVLFLRGMAGVSLWKGFYPLAGIFGIGGPLTVGFCSYSAPYQVAKGVFPVLDPVARGRRRVVARRALGCRSLAHVRNLHGRGGALVSANLRREHMGHRGGGGDARALSVARTDGRARAAGLTTALEDIMATVGFIGL